MSKMTKCLSCGKKIHRTSIRCQSCASKEDWKNTEYLKKMEKRNKKISKIQKGKNNSNWKGDKVKYIGLHMWIARHKPKPEFCEHCKEKKKLELGNTSGKYKRDINDFEWLCRRCHMKKDGKIKNLLKRKGLFSSIETKKKISKGLKKAYAEGRKSVLKQKRGKHGRFC